MGGGELPLLEAQPGELPPSPPQLYAYDYIHIQDLLMQLKNLSVGVCTYICNQIIIYFLLLFFFKDFIQNWLFTLSRTKIMDYLRYRDSWGPVQSVLFNIFRFIKIYILRNFCPVLTFRKEKK